MSVDKTDPPATSAPSAGRAFAAVCDLNGTLRGKRLPADAAEKIADGAVRMPLSVCGVDIWGEDIEGSGLVFESGDADGVCEWTGRGPLPMGPGAALYPLWMQEESGAPFMGDPRRALAAILARYSERGLVPVIATELEFYLFDPSGRRPKAPVSPLTGRHLERDSVLSLSELDQFDDFLNDVYAACAAQQIPADAAIAENGPGQFEINLLHVNDALRAADDAVFFKEIVRRTARAHGFAASFMAKPYGDRAGSGFHVHFSLLDEKGVNVFNDGTEQGSPALLHAVAGLMAAMRDSTVLFAPHLNSYRRLQPGAHAPTAMCWGYENRTAAIRIPGGSPTARRIEHRVAGADANPYLVLCAILGAALSGIEDATPPPAPITGNAYRQKLEELMPDWASATDVFDASALVRRFLPERLISMFVECKEQEQAVFARRVTDFEYLSYLEIV